MFTSSGRRHDTSMTALAEGGKEEFGWEGRLRAASRPGECHWHCVAQFVPTQEFTVVNSVLVSQPVVVWPVTHARQVVSASQSLTGWQQLSPTHCAQVALLIDRPLSQIWVPLLPPQSVAHGPPKQVLTAV